MHNMEHLAMGEIIIGSLGGTIAMTRQHPDGGVTPSLTAKALLDSIPGFVPALPVSAHSILQLPSASIGLGDMIDVLHWCETRAAQGASAIILTQGTDSIEETAWFLDLFWAHRIPLIVTGAMRTPDSAGADGPANLQAALQTAQAAESAGRGVLVVMNDTIHAARRVRKSDALAVQTFHSGPAGALGRMVEGSPHYFAAPLPRHTLSPPQRSDHEVALVTMTLGMGPGLLRHALSSDAFSAVVIAGFGAGHVPHWLAGPVGEYAARRPVVVCSRCDTGPTTRATYGYAGSEIDLAQRGAWMGGWLSALKARILIWAIQASGAQPQAIRPIFQIHSRA